MSISLAISSSLYLFPIWLSLTLTISFWTISIKFFLVTIPYNKSRALNKSLKLFKTNFYLELREDLNLMDSSLSSRQVRTRSLCAWTLFGWVFKILLIARSPKYLRFWSESSIKILSFWTQSWMDALWLGKPLDIDIKTAITVLMHSYSNDIADVLQRYPINRFSFQLKSINRFEGLKSGNK